MPSPDRFPFALSTFRSTPVTHGGHRGYSLLELMIVLAILTALAGMSWPALMRPWSKNLVQQAGQELARELNRTRGLAIERSCILHMRWRPGGVEYQVARAQEANPFDASRGSMPATDPLATNSPATNSPGANPGEAAGLATSPEDASALAKGTEARAAGANVSSSFQLPEGVRFRARVGSDPGGRVATPDPNEIAGGSTVNAMDAPVGSEATEGLDALLADSVAWSETVTFYPDGRATNARWTLESRDGYELEVTLRGLTGMATVGPVRAMVLPAEPGGVETPESASDAPASPDVAPVDAGGNGP